MSHPKEEPSVPTLWQRFMKSMNMGIGQLLWKAIVAVCGFFILASVASLKTSANNFIARSPSTVANAAAASAAGAAAQEAKDAVAVAKEAAQKASDKAAEALALSGKIFAAIQEGNAKVESLKEGLVGSTATTTAQLNDLAGRLKRIEDRQDAGK